MSPLPLSVLIDQLEADSNARDRAFVRGLGRWLVERVDHLRIDVVDSMQLSNVVVTFQMKDRVKLIITGSPPDGLPGDVTVTIDERHFAAVNLFVSQNPSPDPYEVCTLDYSLADQRVRVKSGRYQGHNGTVVVAATVGIQQQNRVCLDSGETVTVEGDALEIVE